MSGFSSHAFAWGSDGHTAIGVLAIKQVQAGPLRELEDIIVPLTNESIQHACNWPDSLRETEQGEWSGPLHYVNIPHSTSEYERERDCPEGRCVTEGILHFANQLSYDGLPREKRWQAFAFVCHLVADLHQPLHAGFRDDRGGNTVDIVYRGEEWNLHQFWDGVVVRERLQDEGLLINQLVKSGDVAASQDWSPAKVKAWTEESHVLAASKAYPENDVIDQAFADQSWDITVERWELAAARLAKVLNAVLGENETLVE